MHLLQPAGAIQHASLRKSGRWGVQFDRQDGRLHIAGHRREHQRAPVRSRRSCVLHSAPNRALVTSARASVALALKLDPMAIFVLFRLGTSRSRPMLSLKMRAPADECRDGNLIFLYRPSRCRLRYHLYGPSALLIQRIATCTSPLGRDTSSILARPMGMARISDSAQGKDGEGRTRRPRRGSPRFPNPCPPRASTHPALLPGSCNLSSLSRLRPQPA